jgi:hypothetical protein
MRAIVETEHADRNLTAAFQDDAHRVDAQDIDHQARFDGARQLWNRRLLQQPQDLDGLARDILRRRLERCLLRNGCEMSNRNFSAAIRASRASRGAQTVLPNSW